MLTVMTQHKTKILESGVKNTHPIEFWNVESDVWVGSLYFMRTSAQYMAYFDCKLETLCCLLLENK